MPCVRGIKVRRLEGFQIEDLADRYRDQYARCSMDQAVNMELLLETIDGTPVDLPVAAGRQGVIQFACVDRMPANVLGRTKFDAESRTAIIEVSEATYANVRKGIYFDRSTVAHELFHVKTHIRELVRISELTNEQFSLARATSHHVNCRDSEWQAERFSPAFIAPAEGLRHLQRHGDLTVYDVQRLYQMDMLSAQYRISDFIQAERMRAAAIKRGR